MIIQRSTPVAYDRGREAFPTLHLGTGFGSAIDRPSTKETLVQATADGQKNLLIHGRVWRDHRDLFGNKISRSFSVFNVFPEYCVWNPTWEYLVSGEDLMDETPLIQQYLQHRSEFMGYLYAITRDAELSEEIYQNAAVVVMEKAAQPETIRNFRAWAKEVVRRQALHAIRARATAKRHGQSVLPELLEAVSIAFIDDTSDDSVTRDEASALRKCLEGLPRDKRELIALRYEGSSSFDEISKHTGSTPAAVQRALSRIRKLLHGCVQKRLQLAEGSS